MLPGTVQSGIDLRMDHSIHYDSIHELIQQFSIVFMLQKHFPVEYINVYYFTCNATDVSINNSRTECITAQVKSLLVMYVPLV